MAGKQASSRGTKKYQKPELTKFTPLREITVATQCNKQCTTVSLTAKASC